MKCSFVIKQCTKCNKLLVAYSGNFNKIKGGKWGLKAICKKCEMEYKAEYRKNNKEKISEYRANNREKALGYSAKYRKNNKEEIAEYRKQYYEENPHIVFNNNQKRRQLEENQGRGITKEQWYEMMCFFEWKCAYSGEYIGGNNESRTVDHIIPLSKGGLNEIWNCVPMFKIYNSNKHDKDMENWYKQQSYFCEEKLIKIYTWCEYAWNKWKPRRKGNKKIVKI